MSKKKVIGCVVAGATVATAVTAKVMRNKAQKSTYKADSINSINPRKMGFYEKYVKRVIDITCATCAIVVFSPLYLGVALLVRTKLGSPVLFTQDRPGLIGPDGKETVFKMYKFRSMTDERDENGELLPDDVRLTKFGKWIRNTSLDELPEAFNILNGNMSIIGPRPGLWNQDVLTAERDKYGANDVKPGLTGWAQINGRDELEIPEKAKLDGYYVQNMGFKMDAKVFLRSVHVFGKDESVVEGGTGEMKKQSEEKKIKKKILVICQYYKPEPFRISDICEEMVRRGHEVHVVTGYPNYPEGIIYEGYGKGKYIDEVVNGVKIHRCYTIPRETGIIKRMLNYYSYAVSSTRYVLSNKCIASD